MASGNDDNPPKSGFSTAMLVFFIILCIIFSILIIMQGTGFFHTVKNQAAIIKSKISENDPRRLQQELDEVNTRMGTDEVKNAQQMARLTKIFNDAKSTDGAKARAAQQLINLQEKSKMIDADTLQQSVLNRQQGIAQRQKAARAEALKKSGLVSAYNPRAYIPTSLGGQQGTSWRESLGLGV